MVQITFIEASGERHVVDGQPGYTVMEVAIWNDIPGIEAICGGTCNCATCHVYIEPPWRDRLPPQTQQELEMLDGHKDRQPGSRLSCQIKVTPGLNELTVQLPACQRDA